MDIEKTMQFLLDMQVRHETWLQKHEEVIQANDQMMSRLVEFSDTISKLIEQNSMNIKELREAQAASDRRLNALIEALGRARKNGHDQPS